MSGSCPGGDGGEKLTPDKPRRGNGGGPGGDAEPVGRRPALGGRRRTPGRDDEHTPHGEGGRAGVTGQCQRGAATRACGNGVVGVGTETHRVVEEAGGRGGKRVSEVGRKGRYKTSILLLRRGD